MLELKSIENRGTEAVKKLRKQKFSRGFPFMINSKELMTNQCYLEYPNGIIKLARITKSASDFDIIRELTQTEAQILRSRYRLYL
jgi:hypothetical protein